MYQWLKLRSDQIEFLKLVLKYMGNSRDVPDSVRDSTVDGYVQAALDFADQRYAELNAALDAAVDMPPMDKPYTAPVSEQRFYNSLPAETVATIGGTPLVAPKAKAAPKPKPKQPRPTVGKKSPTARQTPNWTAEEDAILLGYKDVDPMPWDQIVERLPERNLAACKSRLKRILDTRDGGGGAEAVDAASPDRADEPLHEKKEALRDPPASHPAIKDEPFIKPATSAQIAEAVSYQNNQRRDPPASHPAIKDEPFIRAPTKDELMGKPYGR